MPYGHRHDGCPAIESKTKNSTNDYFRPFNMNFIMIQWVLQTEVQQHYVK